MTLPDAAFHCPAPLFVAKVILVGSAAPRTLSQERSVLGLRPMTFSQKRSGTARCLPLSSVVLGPSLNCNPLRWQARDHAASNTVRLVDDSTAAP